MSGPFPAPPNFIKGKALGTRLIFDTFHLFISQLMGIPWCLSFSHSGERASVGKQFFWSKRYVGFVSLFVALSLRFMYI